MDSILEDVLNAIEIWLKDLQKEEKQNYRLNMMKNKINRSVMQIQFEGLNSIVDMARIHFVANTWISILEIMRESKTDEVKRHFITHILKLFDCGEISLTLCSEMIMQLL